MPQIVVSTAKWRTRSSVAGILSRILRGFAIYLLALSLIGHSGDTLYRWVLANPDDGAIFTIAFVIIWMVLHFSYSSSHESESIPRSLGTAVMAGSVIVKPTARDNRYTAAHEAGHMLPFAALGYLPLDVKAVICNQSDHNGVLGSVTGIKSLHCLEEKTFSEWYMLVLLAGKLGEAQMLGESTVGSTNDHTRWLNMAKQYLSNHYRGMFYPEPQNEYEQKSNEEKLCDLQSEQLSMLTRLFDLNTGVFRELADALLEKRILEHAELIPFLIKVKLPEDFPLPFGSFEVFSTSALLYDDK